MHNIIHFGYGNWEKVCMKRSWQREDAKKCGPALHTDKNFIRNWFLVFKLGYFRKQKRVEHILFWKKKKKTLKFLGLLFHPWTFWTKQSYSSLKNPAKLYDTYWGWNQILCDFFFIAPENFSYFLFSPRKFHIVFLQYFWKIQVLDKSISSLLLNRQTIDFNEILGRIILSISFLE